MFFGDSTSVTIQGKTVGGRVIGKRDGKIPEPMELLTKE